MAPERSPEDFAKTNYVTAYLMNQKTTYEITITEKLGQVTVPDMSEMIWSRIEAELDLDPGDIDGGDTPSPATPPAGIIFGGVGLLFIASLFLYFLNTKNTNKDNTEFVTPTIESGIQTPPTIKPPASNSAESKPALINAEQKQMPTDSIDYNEQVTATPAIIQPIIDSTSQTADNDAVTLHTNTAPPVRKDSLPPQKKRGVTGISPGDYKIVPKKDSN